MLKFTLTTLGCKVNQYDGAALSAMLRRAGLRRAEKGDRADLIVVNTCCVTQTAMRKSRQALRRAVRAAPGARVLVVGCYGRYDADAIAGVLGEAGVPRHRACVLDNNDDLAGRLRRFLCHAHKPDGQSNEPAPAGEQAGFSGNDKPMTALSRAGAQTPAGPEYISPFPTRSVKLNIDLEHLGIDRFEGRQRAFVKVQDGCDAFCSYCIVPHCRSEVYSRPVEQVVRECGRLVEAGHPEVVLCGVFLGAYGRDTTVRRRWPDHSSPLAELLARVAETDRLWRVRLSSLEPGDLTDELLAVIRDNPKVAPHLHLPLQSGSDAVLGRMNRQYTAGQYRDAVARLRDALDRPALTTDVIVGFPGETDADFAETLRMVRDAGFARVHAFPFSAVRGTAAWRVRHEAPPVEKVRRRMDELTSLAAETAGAYRQQFIGDMLEGVVESTDAGRGRRVAMTDRYQTVTFDAPDDDDLTGSVLAFVVEGATDDGLIGRALPPPRPRRTMPPS